jgi:hypothetical protein
MRRKLTPEERARLERVIAEGREARRQVQEWLDETDARIRARRREAEPRNAG